VVNPFKTAVLAVCIASVFRRYCVSAGVGKGGDERCGRWVCEDLVNTGRGVICIRRRAFWPGLAVTFCAAKFTEPN
jgi:hypothetical protein